jgi:Glycosyl transferase family 2
LLELPLQSAQYADTTQRRQFIRCRGQIPVLSVIVPTLNSELVLTRTLAGLLPAMLDGLVRQVIVADGGSSDRTCALSEDAGVDVIAAPQSGDGRVGSNGRLAAGAAHARHPWLLFIQPGTVFGDAWHHEAGRFMAAVNNGTRPQAAAAFRLAVEDAGFGARMAERAVGWWCTGSRLPFAEQGLLIPKALYERTGGYSALSPAEACALFGRLRWQERAMLVTPVRFGASALLMGGLGVRGRHVWRGIIINSRLLAASPREPQINGQKG